MRKISHIDLGNFLLEQRHISLKKRSFILGNILPDCLPSFIYVRHNIESTLPKVIKLIEELKNLKTSCYKFWIKLGCVMHYIADYFTYPHTKMFQGGFFLHNKYEKKLKDNFKRLINFKNYKTICFQSTDEIVNFIKREQKLYFKEKEIQKENIELDVKYISFVCNTIFSNIIRTATI